jgi:hypothetical protein
MLGSLWHDLVEEDLKKQRVVSLPQAVGPMGLPRGEEIFFSFFLLSLFAIRESEKVNGGCDLYGRPLKGKMG